MASTNENKSLKKPRIPLYQDIDGFRIPGMFSADAYKSAIAYKPRPDDLFIVTYPKCGTTWVQHIIGCIFRKGQHFTSFVEFMLETPFLEMTGAEAAETMRRPGAIKLHLPFHLTPYSPDAKYIFVARNPKDCLISFYHHTENIPGYEFVGGDFDEYFELFIEGKVDFGDYFDTLLSWYEHRNDPNVLFMTYEQLKKNTRERILEMANFIGPQYKEMLLEDNEQILKDVMHHSSFAYMKEYMNNSMADMSCLPKEFIIDNPDIPPGLRKLFMEDVFPSDPSNTNFIRKGIVGDWKNYLSPSQNERLEKKFRERTAGTDIPELWKDDM